MWVPKVTKLTVLDLSSWLLCVEDLLCIGRATGHCPCVVMYARSAVESVLVFWLGDYEAEGLGR